MHINLAGSYSAYMVLLCLTRQRKHRKPTTMKITLLMLIVIGMLIECSMAEHAVEVKSGHRARLIRPRGW